MVYFEVGWSPIATKWKTDKCVMLSNGVALISNPDIAPHCLRSNLDKKQGCFCSALMWF